MTVGEVINAQGVETLVGRVVKTRNIGVVGVVTKIVSPPGHFFSLGILDLETNPPRPVTLFFSSRSTSLVIEGEDTR